MQVPALIFDPDFVTIRNGLMKQYQKFKGIGCAPVAFGTGVFSTGIMLIPHIVNYAGMHELWALLIFPWMVLCGIFFENFYSEMTYEENAFFQQELNGEADQILSKVLGEKPVPKFTVFLRSFQDHGYVVGDPRGHRMIEGGFKDDMGRVLVEAFRGVPVLGCGERKEEYRIGNPDVTSNNEDWFLIVKQLCKAAEKIVCVPADSDGIAKEIIMIFDDKELLSKSVFIMPPNFDDYGVFSDAALAWARARDQLMKSGVVLPAYDEQGRIFTAHGNYVDCELRCLENPEFVRMAIATLECMDRRGYESTSLETFFAKGVPVWRDPYTGKWPR